ncbi:MAG: glycosyltransferase [Candidatus Hydrogenedens sp.]|jgi:glycosyltransferase involved in cell wall biosynthesis|nr:glycosyltransferase [Candidatus Hydrogenedens sp.]
MKIVHIVPGSGGTFYCQNCLRDTAIVRALREEGHDVLLTPMYLPLFADDATLAEEVPVFFGGINVYLQQRFPIFRKTPAWLDRLFDASWLLRMAAKQESSTSARDLGPMTLSMLQGDAGNQSKEVARLIHWLKEQEKPDAVHLSNALLLGLAPQLKAGLDCPVFCTLQDEDTWVDVMPADEGEACWQAMARAGESVDAFVAVSQWYADKVREKMAIPPEKLKMIYLGVDNDTSQAAELPFDPPVIGYLSRLAPGQGLDLLIDAFIALKKKPEFATLRLRATGGITSAYRKFIEDMKKKLRRENMLDDVDFLEDFGKEERRKFLRSLTLLSVPAPEGEAFGAFILEALANGVPVVQPAAGAFPEVVQETGGGIIYDPQQPGAYEEALASLLSDPEKAIALGETGRNAVESRFNIQTMARSLASLYEECLDRAAD